MFGTIVKIAGRRVVRAGGYLALKAIKYGPGIGVIGGTAGMLVGAVMGIKATPKAMEVAAQYNEELAQIEEVHDTAAEKGLDYSEHDYKIDKRSNRVNMVFAVLRVYLPTIIVLLASATSTICGFFCLRARYLEMAAAYAEVVNQYNEEHKDDLIEYETEDENGEKTVKTRAKSPYSVLYDETTTTNWSTYLGQNHKNLENLQKYANDKLHAKGYLFLNEVLEDLGLPKSKAGQFVGWTYDLASPRGDNYIDFGIPKFDKEDPFAGLWLNFNCDGEILDIL